MTVKVFEDRGSGVCCKGSKDVTNASEAGVAVAVSVDLFQVSGRK